MKVKLASTHDIMSLMELMLDIQAKTNPRPCSCKPVDFLAISNIATIKEKDKLLVVSSNYRILSVIISYLYFPDVIFVSDQRFFEEEQSVTFEFARDWSETTDLLPEFHHVEPSFLIRNYLDAPLEQGCLDVLIYYTEQHYIFSEKEKSKRSNSQEYNPDNDPEFSRYTRALHYAGRVLKQDGVLVVSVKPVWILKTWDLLHELSLQVDYPHCHLYPDQNRHPETLIVIRLTKVADLNITVQKNNITHIMETNKIDRLYAFKNRMTFPYVELPAEDPDPYIEMAQKTEDQQYFFTLKTTQTLAELCTGYTACLATPSVALYACEAGFNIVLFEQDNRFRQTPNLKYVKYDLCKGLNALTKRKYGGAFNTVICDPPFNINPSVLARDILELVKIDVNSRVYLVFPESKKGLLVHAMKTCCFFLDETAGDIAVEYSKPPKIVRWHGKSSIGLYLFKPSPGSDIFNKPQNFPHRPGRFSGPMEGSSESDTVFPE